MQSNQIDEQEDSFLRWIARVEESALRFVSNLSDERRRKLRVRIAMNSSSSLRRLKRPIIWSDLGEQRSGSEIDCREKKIGLERLKVQDEARVRLGWMREAGVGKGAREREMGVRLWCALDGMRV